MRKVAFFRSWFDVPTPENKQRVIRLPAYTPDCIDALLTEMYGPVFNGRVKEDARRTFGDSEAPHPEWFTIVQDYVLAKQCAAENMPNGVLDLIVSNIAEFPPSAVMLKLIIERTEQGDQLRELLMERFADVVHQNGGWMAFKANNKESYKELTQQEHEYAIFALESLAKYPEGKRDGKDYWAIAKYDRHVHVDTPRCDAGGN